VEVVEDDRERDIERR